MSDWKTHLIEAETHLADDDYEGASVSALLAIARQGEYVIETRSNRELDLRLGALGAAISVFGHVLTDSPNTERPAVLAELLGYAEAFAGFLGAQSGQA